MQSGSNNTPVTLLAVVIRLRLFLIKYSSVVFDDINEGMQEHINSHCSAPCGRFSASTTT